VNEHPEILLAEYVDGTLSPDARAEMEAHLAGCARCREELALAEEARGALGRLSDVPPPEGLTFLVRRRAGRGLAPRTARWVAAGAAAAVLVGGGIVAVSTVLGGGDDQAAPGEAPAEAGGGVEAPDLERGADQEDAVPQGALAAGQSIVPLFDESDRDYDQDDLVALGRRVRNRARATIQAGLAPTATEFFQDFDTSAFTPRVRQAVDCSLREVPPEQLLVPFSIEAASFQGEPAYVAAFLQGPAPDLPYDRVVIWVVARDTCSLRSLATQRL
jgi:anti-sigma factor RsiW